MAIVYFPSLDQADVVEIHFAKPAGGETSLRLLVDSGFTGQSSFVLGDEGNEFAQAAAPSAEVAGAIQGVQKRIVISCRIAAFPLQLTAIAIITDLSSLALPSGIAGIAGLRFLRQFFRWGAEKTESGAWRFFLETQE